ncbi:MAG: multiheme c-type cytochrome [Candidatus Zixiibacteriota bacterium]
MLRKLTVLVILMAVMALFSGFAMAQDKAEAKTETKAAAKHEYVGADKCKMCHKKDGVHPSWETTKHAKAWDLLSEEEKKDKECVRCHSTGTTAEGELLVGVQCETCHGPGSDYKKMSTMKDRELAIAAGLLIPNEKTCLTCHEGVPEKFRSKEKFDFEKMKAKGVHAMPVKEEKKEG